MKNALLLSTALGMLTTAPLYAQSFTDRVVETLSQQGFQTVEIDNGPTQTKFEAVRDGTKMEVVYDRASGEILSQETEPFTGRLVEDQPIEVDSSTRDFVGDNRDDGDDDNDDDDEDHDNDERDDDDDNDRDDDDDNDRDDDRDDDSDSDDSGESDSDDSGESDSDGGGDDDGDDD